MYMTVRVHGVESIKKLTERQPWSENCERLNTIIVQLFMKHHCYFGLCVKNVIYSFVISRIID